MPAYNLLADKQHIHFYTKIGLCTFISVMLLVIFLSFSVPAINNLTNAIDELSDDLKALNNYLKGFQSDYEQLMNRTTP